MAREHTAEGPPSWRFLPVHGSFGSVIAAVVLTGLVGAACTTRVSPSTTSTVPEITATSSTSLPDPVSSSTSTSMSSLPTVHAVDLAAAFRAAPVGEPIEVIELPWGDRPGEVGYSAVFGPCCFDVTPDGGIVIEDSQNLRYQYFDGERWEVLASTVGTGRSPTGSRCWRRASSRWSPIPGATRPAGWRRGR